MTWESLASVFHLVRAALRLGEQNRGRATRRSAAFWRVAPPNGRKPAGRPLGPLAALDQAPGPLAMRPAPEQHRQQDAGTPELRPLVTAPCSPRSCRSPSPLLQPSNQACEVLGVGLTIFKRICRKYGLHRWPYRALKKQVGGRACR